MSEKKKAPFKQFPFVLSAPSGCSWPGVLAFFFLIIMRLILSQRSSVRTINFATVSLEKMALLLSLLSHPHSFHLQEIKPRPALLFSLLLSIMVKNYLLVFLLNRTGHRAIRQEIMAWRLAVWALHYNVWGLDGGENWEASH